MKVIKISDKYESLVLRKFPLRIHSTVNTSQP